MATIYNSSLTKEMIQAAKLQTSRDKVPSETSDKVVFTCETNPKLLRRSTILRNSTVSTSANGTVYTTPTNQDFYLTGAQLSFIKDATCDIANGNVFIQVTVDGNTDEVIKIPVLTLTAQADSVFIQFTHPLKLDRNTNIVNGRSGAHAAGTLLREVTIMGYIDETSNA